ERSRAACSRASSGCAPCWSNRATRAHSISPRMVEVAQHLKGRDFTRIGTWNSEELKTALDLADELKELRRKREPHALLSGRTLGRLSGVRLASIGDGSSVCVSLRVGAARFGVRFVAATPKGYEPDADAVTAARRAAVQMGGTVELVHDAKEAAHDAEVLYTDVWTSMGQEEEAERRRSDLAGFGIDDGLLSVASPDAIVLHCLPAHYGEEITEEVLYGPHSAVWHQSEI